VRGKRGGGSLASSGAAQGAGGEGGSGGDAAPLSLGGGGRSLKDRFTLSATQAAHCSKTAPASLLSSSSSSPGKLFGGAGGGAGGGMRTGHAIMDIGARPFR